MDIRLLFLIFCSFVINAYALEVILNPYDGLDYSEISSYSYPEQETEKQCDCSCEEYLFYNR